MKRSTRVLLGSVAALLCIFLTGNLGLMRSHAQTAAPVIDKLFPTEIAAGAPTFTVRLQGKRFQQGAMILLNGSPLASSRVHNNKILLAEVDASFVASAGTLTVQAINPDTTTTGTETITVVAPDPDIIIRLAGNVAQESPGFSLQINISGQGFDSHTRAEIWGQKSPLTTLNSSTSLTVIIPQFMVKFAARIPIYVRNKGGLLSNVQIFFIVAAPPRIISVTPDSVVEGSAPPTLNVFGSNLMPDATIVVNGQPLPTTVKATKLVAILPAEFLTAPGELVVRIEQGGLQSHDATIIVSPTLGPFIFAISPDRLRVGSATRTIDIDGANFTAGSKVLLDGQDVPIKSRVNRVIQIKIDKAFLAMAGVHTLQVVDKDGNASGQVSFQIAPDVNVTTLAGHNSVGLNTGCVGGATAHFYGPRRVSLGPDGLLYVTDQTNNAIRSVNPATAEVCTIASNVFLRGAYADSGDQSDIPPAFAYPNGIVAAQDGTLYVTDNGNSVIRKLVRGPGGTFTLSTFAGTSLPIKDASARTFFQSTRFGVPGSLDGPALGALFREPDDIIIAPDGTMYVSDPINESIRRIRQTASGPVVETIAGDGVPGFVDGAGATARFTTPTGIALSADGQSLYVADFVNNRIRRIDLATLKVSTFAGSGESGNLDGTPAQASFNGPIGIAVDADGTLYVSEFIGNLIRRVDTAGNVSTFAGSGAERFLDGLGLRAAFRGMRGIALDQRARVLYVADFDNEAVRAIALQ
jgi:sugar lactone lactonase YvrE